MGINNFVTGDSKRHASEESLLKTEKTDAVNSGLVGSSDRTRSSMVSSAAEKHAAGNRGAIRPKGGVADVTAAPPKGSRLQTQYLQARLEKPATQ